MEDFLKIIIIAASIVYAVAKKRAAKRSTGTPRPHDEAWPQETAPEGGIPARSIPDSSVHPAPAKEDRGTGSDTPQTPGHDSRRMQQQGSAAPATARNAEPSGHRNRKYRTAAPQPLRESDRRSVPDNAGDSHGPNSAFEEFLRRTAGFGSGKPQQTATQRSSVRTTAATAPAPQEIPLPAEPDDTAAGNLSAAGLREEFDLRRAVIYSEILKPKFEE